MSDIHDPQESQGSESESSIRQETAQRAKRRRLHGACDNCRKKKIKCNSAERPGNICSNCEVVKIDCTHLVPHGPKKAERQKVYINSLEEKIKKFEIYFHIMYPGQDFDVIINTVIAKGPAALARKAPTDEISFTGNFNSTFTYPTPRSPPSDITLSPAFNAKFPADSDDSDTEDLAHISLSAHFDRLSLGPLDNRYFGQASAYVFGKNVSMIRSNSTGETMEKKKKFKRNLYWEHKPWEVTFFSSMDPTYVYPDDDLLRSLCGFYFERLNHLFPIIHRPTFMKALDHGLHHFDPSFGMTVLLICALGSRYSQDVRVRVTGDETGLSVGWKYFCQVSIHRRSLFYKITIYDIQYFCLATLYLVGTSIPQASWDVLGIGLRCAMHRGVHRRKTHNHVPTADSEMWKRAFWCLLCLDRMTSSFVGRPCLIPDEEYDLEYPIECDDEYWDTGDPSTDFKQPPGKPSSISAFVFMIKLFEILGFGIRTLYPTKKSKILSGLNKKGDDWETRLVTELDSSLNRWKDSIPHYLRWDPKMTDPVFFHQSVALYSLYYYTQIQIHRPFLMKKSSLSFPSLAICTNAARACTHVLEAAVTRGIQVIPSLIMASYSAGLVITLNLWGLQKSGMMNNPTRDLKDLHACFDILGEIEKRWHVAGRLRDLLSEAASINDYKPSQASKRRRGPDNEEETSNPVHTVAGPLLVNVNPSDAIPTPIPNVANLDWNLDDLLFTEMGLALDNYAAHPTTVFPPHINYGMQGSELPDLAPLFNDETFAVWSDIPTAFSTEEWGAYLANMSQQLPTIM